MSMTSISTGLFSSGGTSALSSAFSSHNHKCGTHKITPRPPNSPSQLWTRRHLCLQSNRVVTVVIRMAGEGGLRTLKHTSQRPQHRVTEEQSAQLREVVRSTIARSCSVLSQETRGGKHTLVLQQQRVWLNIEKSHLTLERIIPETSNQVSS